MKKRAKAKRSGALDIYVGFCMILSLVTGFASGYGIGQHNLQQELHNKTMECMDSMQQNIDKDMKEMLAIMGRDAKTFTVIEMYIAYKVQKCMEEK